MNNSQKCDRVSLVALSLSVFFGIAAFLPSALIPAAILKGYLVIISLLVACVAWLLGRLIEGVFHAPWTPMLAASGIFIIVLFLSAFFSHASYLSLFGEGFEQGTFAVLGCLLVGIFLSSVLFVTHRRISVFLKGLFLVYIVLAVFQFVHLFIPTLTSLNVFFNNVDTPIGLLSDFAVISGAALIGSILALQLSKPEIKTRGVLIAGGILGLFFVMLANIFVIWILVGFSAVLILLYTLISKRFSVERQFPFLAFGLSLIALLFILTNSLFGGVLANLMHVSYVDVHPSIEATTHTLALSLRKHPILGAGPNTFVNEWLRYRPTAINTNMLWNTPFASGSSWLATVAVSGGILGVLACILFLVAFCYESVRKLFIDPMLSSRTKADAATSGSMMVFGLFVITLYFLCAIIFFSPGIAVTVCTFSFIGILFGALVGEGKIPKRNFSFLKVPRTSLWSILGILALLLLASGLVYGATERFVAIVYFEKSLVSANNADFATADLRLSDAIALSDLPTFERARVSLASQVIQQTLALPASSSSSDSVRASLQNAISEGNVAGRQAISLDPEDPQNYLALGDMLTLLIPLKIDGVSDAATDAYQHAITLVPNYPKPYLSLATFYLDSGDSADAKIYAQKALDQKSNYTDASIILAQISASSGDMATALQILQNATDADSTDPDGYFNLGLLHYNSGDYADAISAFNQTLNLNNQYLSAWYYLALADQKTGNTKDATTILTALHTRLPNDHNVANALAGKIPASNVTVSAVTSPSTSTPKKK